MRLVLSIIFSVIFYNISFSQVIELSRENADCKGAINISNKTEIKASAPISEGNISEISSHKGDIYYFQKEHNTVWYTFTTTQTAMLSFIITPDKATDDYDFILFECKGDNCCSDIASKKLKPIRTNISRTKALADGITGLNSMASQKFVHDGKGDNFSSSVKVTKGQKYILVLDNVYGGDGGHSINFIYEAITEKKEQKHKHSLNINIIEKDKSELIIADILIIHYNQDYIADTTIYENKSSLFIPIKVNDYYEIGVRKKGFLYHEISFKAKEDDSLITKTIELVKASKGTSFELKKLYFKGGTAQFTGSYKSTLLKLLRAMKDNPSLKILIKGHVNRPNGAYKHQSEEYYNKLSIDRAKAVNDYLIKRGISEDRLQYMGVGYAEMIYPNATLQSEMQKNRRVEIVVTEF